MSIISVEIQNQVREVFQTLGGPAKIMLFTQGEGGAIECSMCKETCQLDESFR